MQHKENKYGRGDTPNRLEKLWKESQQDITLAKSGEACERLIALQAYKELFVENKLKRTLKTRKDPYGPVFWLERPYS